MTNKPTIYWHDYETFGANPKTDRPVQFAGIRTDMDLNVIGDPLVLYAKPANDYLPHPEACLITGITPQYAIEKGLPETEFIKKILKEFSRANTCVAGYNNLRFDDEITRYTLYRNLFDPYAREWKNGNSRWDIIDLVRVCYALRPDGIVWPKHPDGTPSFRLEDLTRANEINHEGAHDALSDVMATIALARLIRSKQAKLYAYYFEHRNKRLISQLLDFKNLKPVLHTSSMFPVKYCCTALVVPLLQHPTNSNAIVVYDLRHDPAELLSLTSKEIQQRLYARREELPAGLDRIALKTVHINKCPVIVPAKIDDFTANRLEIDKQKCHSHLLDLRGANDLTKKLIAVYQDNPYQNEADPDFSLYSGAFFSAADRLLMDEIHQLPPEALAVQFPAFKDKRLDTLFFRYRARNYPQLLSETEAQDWQEFQHNRLTKPPIASSLSTKQYFSIIDKLKSDENTTASQHSILTKLTDYGLFLTATMDLEVQ